MGKFWWVVAVVMAIHPAAQAGRGGVGHGGGGDAIALEFVSYGKLLADSLVRIESLREAVPEVEQAKFAEAVASTRVYSRDQLNLNGMEVDAINYPDSRLILLNRSRWSAYGSYAPKQVALVFHEYLGILRLDDSNYRISTRLNAWLEENGLPRAPIGERNSIPNCENSEMGNWAFGNAGTGCDSRGFIANALVMRAYHDLIFYTEEPTARETTRYLQAMVPAVSEAAEIYLTSRRPASREEIAAWKRLVAAVVQTESAWSHFRVGRDGRLKIARTDAGHGWGLLAIDDRAHQPVKLVDPILSLSYGMDILFTYWERAVQSGCVSQAADWRSRSRSAYSAFNGGNSKLCRWANEKDLFRQNDQTFVANFDARPWLTMVKDPEIKSGLDLACLLRGGAAACLDAR